MVSAYLAPPNLPPSRIKVCEGGLKWSKSMLSKEVLVCAGLVTASRGQGQLK